MREIRREAIQGIGISLDEKQIPALLNHETITLPWVEVEATQYLEGGIPLLHLKQLRRRCPIVLRGLGLSLGSADPLDTAHLQALKQLIEYIEPAWITDTLAWQSVDGKYVSVPLPLPRTEAVASYVAERVRKVQTYFGRRLLLENVLLYGNALGSTLEDGVFMRTVVESADAYVLLDLGNLLMSAMHLGWNVEKVLQHYPAAKIRQMRLRFVSGAEMPKRIEEAPMNLWALFEKTLQCFGSHPCSIANRDALGSVIKLQLEAQKAQEMLDAACVVA